MVLESILNPKNAEDKPWHVFTIALFFSLVASIFAVQMFSEQSSILTIALVTILFVPFFQKLFEIEEKKEDRAAKGIKEGNLFTRHKRIIFVFSAFFIGIVISMSFIYTFLPKYSNVFLLQTKTIEGFSASATGQGSFDKFFLNNTQVMILTFILSMVFGAGAVLILAWNASVIGVFLGMFVQSSAKGTTMAAAYLYGVPIGLGTIALHGIPEISAYFLAGIAGGILSVGVIREKMVSREFKKIFKDSLIFLAAAELLIILGAWLEAVV